MTLRRTVRGPRAAITLLALIFSMSAAAAVAVFSFTTAYPTSMMNGSTANTSGDFDIQAIYTVGETLPNGYLPVGILDGITAFDGPGNTVRVLVHHELDADSGYAYTQSAGGVGNYMLTGARVSFFDVDPATLEIVDAGLAHERVYDRAGNLVTSAAQINEDGHPSDGFDRFCSAQGVAAGTFGFVDDIHFANEEATNGSVWALDVDDRSFWAVPELGRGAWENITPLDTGRAGTVALLLGDDHAPAPLYLYIGRTNSVGDGSFLDRNGLVDGQLYAWVADRGRGNGGWRPTTPEDFNTTGNFANGQFRKLQVRQLGKAGKEGYDDLGYLDDETLRDQAAGLGAFLFSRPEDLDTNPFTPSQAVFASTGRGQLYPSDNWGALYVVTVDFDKLAGNSLPNNIRASTSILYDGDDPGNRDEGIRSPDNLDWAHDGLIYVQEDRSTSPGSLFGANGIEASMWQIDPITGAATRIGEMDRSVVAPAGVTDPDPTDVGNWESSGVLDVTSLFGGTPGLDTILIADVQAHSLSDGVIGTAGLVQGGQLVILRKNP